MAFLRPTTPPRPYRSTRPGIYEAWNYGIRPEYRDNSDAWIDLVTSIRRSGRGGIIHYEPAPYRFRSALTDALASTSTYGIEHVGVAGATQFLADGQLLASGDLIAPGRYSRFRSIAFGATAQRSAGTSLIKVTGDMNVNDVPSKKLEQIVFDECDLENFYDGVTLLNGTGTNGVCGFWWRGPSYGRGGTAGGNAFVINTKDGVDIFIVKFVQDETFGVAGASRPMAVVQVTAVADMRLDWVEGYYTQNGLRVTPGASGRANTIWASNCIWGGVSDKAVYIAPNATAECLGLKFTSNWVDTGGFNVVGSAVDGLECTGLTCYVNGTGILLDGVTGGATFGDTSFISNTLGFSAINGSTGWNLSGTFGKNGNNGISIAAGCDRYMVNVTGRNRLAGTALTEPSPGANRVMNFF